MVGVSDLGGIAVFVFDPSGIARMDAESKEFADRCKERVISLMTKIKDEDTKEKLKKKPSIHNERIQSRRLSQIFDGVAFDLLPSLEGKEDLSSYEKIVVNEPFAHSMDSKTSKKVCSQNMVDENKVVEDGGDVQDVLETTSSSQNWSKMSREEKIQVARSNS